jgi:hypothetical protein
MKNDGIERILCAAIWFTNEGKQVLFQPKNINEGIVLCGHRHAVIFQQFRFFATDVLKLDVAGRHSLEIYEKEQGFLTNFNRFVGREEAAQIAFDAGQTKEKLIKLFSEDLY